MVSRMMMDFGITVSQLNECLCSIPIFEENITALKLAQSTGAMNFILSDANHHYISVILQHHNISSVFIEIESNFSRIDEECTAADGEQVLARLRISPHQPADSPHLCPLCPRNLCKGNVMAMWRDKYCFEKVVYVGDGGGDFCPVLCLGAEDVVLCRQDYSLHKKCVAAASAATVDKGGEGEQRVRAKVLPWSSGNDILSFFRELF
jgi:pyridoxal phosphate phosphatase PHOSPHO2